MRRLTPVYAVITAALATATVAAAAPTVVIDSGTLRADDLNVYVHLETDVAVAGVQNDIRFEPPGLIAARANGKPLCVVEYDVGRPGSSFTFQPASCAPGDSCTSLRALVLSLANVTPIPSGSTLYSCALAPDAPPGRYHLGCANAGTSGPDGVALATSCADGEIEVIASTVLTARTDHARPGETARIEVTAHSNERATGVETDLAVATLPLRGISTPACVAADGVAATFAFLPDGCTPGADCSGLHASAQSADGEPLPSGEVLFTCGVNVPLTAAVGEYAVELSGASGITADGGAANSSVVGGAVVVFGSPPTPTVETPRPDATPTPPLTRIEVGSATGAPGSRVRIAVTLHTSESIGGVQNDLHFDPQAAIVVLPGGLPDCTPDPIVDWIPGREFSFQPPACVPGLDCTGVRALLLTAQQGATIPSGTVLYSCNVAIDPGANGTAALTCDNAGGSTPDGQPRDVACTGGEVVIEAPSPVPTPTALPAEQPTPTLGTGSSVDSAAASSSCAIAPAADGGWWLVLPLLLAWRRRRHADRTDGAGPSV